MSGTAARYGKAGALLGCLLLALQQGVTAGVWSEFEPRHVGECAPLILRGKIVKVEVAKAQCREGQTLRYLDVAHVEIEKVLKNGLSDVEVKVGGTFAVHMHSEDTTVPDYKGKDGKRMSYSTSTDLRYKKGKEGIWFVFLGEDGKFCIHHHPQQFAPADREAKLAKQGAFQPAEKKLKAEEWARKGKSRLR